LHVTTEVYILSTILSRTGPSSHVFVTIQMPMPHVQPCSFFFFFKGVKPTKKDRKSNAQENSIPLPLWLPCCRALASRHRRPATTRAGMVFFGGAHLTTPAIQGGCWRCCFCCGRRPYAGGSQGSGSRSRAQSRRRRTLRPRIRLPEAMFLAERMKDITW